MKVVRQLLLDQSLPIGGGAVVALCWAAVDPVRYFSLARSLTFAVNDVGMAFFLALVAQETLEAVRRGGALHTWRLWAVPVTAAFGGIAGATLTYEMYVHAAHETVLASGWPVVCATDIAVASAVARRAVGRSAVPFVVLAAITGDALGAALVSWHQVLSETSILGVVAITGGIAVGGTLASRRVRSVWPYVIVGGSLSWWGFTQTGLNPALALLPIVPFLPRDARGVDLLRSEGHERIHPRHFESVFRLPVQAVLFLFALVNAGVLARGYGTGSFALLTADLLGRPIGALTAVAIAVRVGLTLPKDVTWKEIVVITVALSGGVTFALLFAASLYPVGPALNQLKMGALGTTVAVPLTVVLAWRLRAGAFATDGKFALHRRDRLPESTRTPAVLPRRSAH